MPAAAPAPAPAPAANPPPAPYDHENPPPSYVDDYGSTYFLLPAPTNWQAKPKFANVKPTPAVPHYNNPGYNNPNYPAGPADPRIIIVTVTAGLPAPVATPTTPPATVTVTSTSTVNEYGYNYNVNYHTYTTTVGVVTTTRWRYQNNCQWGTIYKLEHYKREVVPGLAAGLGIAGAFMLLFMLQLMFPRLNFWGKVFGAAWRGTRKGGAKARGGLVGMLGKGQSALAGRGEMEYRRLAREDDELERERLYKDGGEEGSAGKGILRSSEEEERESLV